jgi:hypothetical protein
VTAETDAMWAEFDRRLVWRPIAEFDREEAHVALLRSGDNEAIGYWDDGAWWHAQESLDGQKLAFEPTEFADVDDEWRVHLMAD